LSTSNPRRLFHYCNLKHPIQPNAQNKGITQHSLTTRPQGAFVPLFSTYTLFALLIFLTSCKSDNQTPKEYSFPGAPPVSLMDKDRDGLSDPYEQQNKTTTDITNFPSIQIQEDLQSHITLSQKTFGSLDVEWKSSVSHNSAHTLRLTRKQMAKNSYEDRINLSEEKSPISFSPLPTIALTHLLNHQWNSFNETLKEIKKAKGSYTLNVESSIPLKLAYFDGIKEVKNIAAKIGYLKEGKFVEITKSFILKDDLDRPLTLGEMSAENRAQLNIEFNNEQTLEDMISTRSQLLMKITDYESFTKENHHYTFSKQWKYALSDAKPIFISTPDTDRIFLIQKEMKYQDALKRIYPDFEMKSHSLQTLGGFTNEYLEELPLTQMNNKQLTTAQWHIITQGNSIFIGHYSALEMAQSKEAVIAQDQIIMNNDLKHHNFDKLRIGEIIKISYNGHYNLPEPLEKESIVTNVVYDKVTYTRGPSLTCRSKPGINCRGDRNLEPGLPQRILVRSETTCLKISNEVAWKEQNLMKDDLLIMNQEGAVITPSDLIELTGASSFFNKDTKLFEIEFKITQDFIHRYGEELNIYIRNNQDQKHFDIGTVNIQCEDKLPTDFNYPLVFGESHIQEFNQINDVQLHYLRKF